MADLIPNAEQLTGYVEEIIKCRNDTVYFIDNYCHIEDPVARAWIPFKLWPMQKEAIPIMARNKLVVALKGRQVGYSWIALCLALHEMLFFPIATVLLFSLRDTEAVDLLKKRLRGIYNRLPRFLQVEKLATDNDHELGFSNGSRAMAFPTTAGDSYSGTLAIVDEADLVPNLADMLSSVKPTIDAGGRLILISRAVKANPTSVFKAIYVESKKGGTEWTPVFIPWYAHPGRDEKFIEARKAECLAQTGTLDAFYEAYPSTDTEALAPAQKDKRLPFEWLKECYKDVMPLLPEAFERLPKDRRPPSLIGLTIYKAPRPGDHFVVGCDPAEGNPNSDESADIVMNKDTGEEVAFFGGRFEPFVFASYTADLAVYYNNAPVMVERNNHGHSVISWLRDNTNLTLLCGHDNRPGNFTTTKAKSILYSEGADAFRDGDTTIHNFGAFNQLASIEVSTLKAPEGQADDRAVAFVLAILGRNKLLKQIPSDGARGPAILTAPPNVFGPLYLEAVWRFREWLKSLIDTAAQRMADWYLTRNV